MVEIGKNTFNTGEFTRYGRSTASIKSHRLSVSASSSTSRLKSYCLSVRAKRRIRL